MYGSKTMTKRYRYTVDKTIDSRNQVRMREHPDGEWVKWERFEDIQRRLVDRTHERDELVRRLEEQRGANESLRNTIAKLESALAGLDKDHSPPK